MKISTKEFRIREGHKLRLKKLSTKVKPVYKSDEHYKELLAVGLGHIYVKIVD